MALSTKNLDKIFDLLAAEKHLDAADLRSLATQHKTIAELGQDLVGKKVLTTEAYYQLVARALDMAYVDARNAKVARGTLELVPYTVAEHYQVVVLASDGGVVEVGLSDPLNFQAIEAVDFLAKQKKYQVNFAVISPESFDEVLSQYHSLSREVGAALKEVQLEDLQKKKNQPASANEDIDQLIIAKAPVSKIVSVVIRHAVEGGASDIHIEPTTSGSRIRYRIDGILKTSLTLPAYIHSPIISRIKVLANLKLDETRIPQDGRISLDVDGRSIDFRVSVMPLLKTEKAVLRILDTSDGISTLAQLGYNPVHVQLIEKSIKQPHGLLLISGPTGSGKSTTLYSILTLLNKEGINLVTLEDPIEFHIDGVNQSQIRPEIDYTFASGLRSLLRQDPDVIMVGEIRDAQTAEMAIQAALTGHLMFSTIHTNDSFGIVPRLVDMNVEPFLLASTLNVMVAQRLTRRVCQQCRQAQDIPAYLHKMVDEQLAAVPERYRPEGVDLKNPQFFKGRGCAACDQTGYQGRISIAEVFEIDEEFRHLIVTEYSPDKMKAAGVKQQAITLIQDGLIKATQGLTTVEEVLRVIQE